MPSGLTEMQQTQLAHVDRSLADDQNASGFAQELFFGRFKESSLLPFPELDDSDQQSRGDRLRQIDEFCNDKVDAAQIESDQNIPAAVLQGLADLGVLGSAIDSSLGGQGNRLAEFSAEMEVLGAHCAATAALVAAQHSAGLKALELFGSEAQQAQWCAAIAQGKKQIAFALTEEQAGSDINNVRTRAEADGQGFSLTGQKRWITNAANADVLIVLARTPDHANPDGAVTAFLVTPDQAGFTITDKRIDKIGVNGIATGSFSLDGVSVGQDDVLGEIGQGMKVANVALTHGRLASSAAAVGATSFCIDQMVNRATSRHQFGLTLGKFGLVKEKISAAIANRYAIQSANLHLADLLDREPCDGEVEAAMIKVFASNKQWQIVNDCLQIWGGAGIFKDHPFEQRLRDARVNLLGDCANDALRSYIALVAFRHVDKEMADDDAGIVGSITKKLGVMSESLLNPSVPVKHDHLKFYSRTLSRQIGQFSWQLKSALSKNSSKIYNQQHVQGRLADIAIELFLSSCVYGRISSAMVNGTVPQSTREKEFHVAQLFLSQAGRRVDHLLEDIKLNCDDQIDAVAADWLGDSA